MDPHWKEQIRTAPTPAEAKRLGRATPDYDEGRWSAIKEAVMMRTVRAKFTQHKQLQKILLDTGKKLVVEDTPDDPYWGVVKGKGKNRMGHLLMELREELRAEDQPEEQFP